ncbi:MAG: hypothetical protein ACK5JS_09235 [Mangrovibacterium sp.]
MEVERENSRGVKYMAGDFKSLLNAIRNNMAHYIAKWGPVMKMDNNREIREFLVQAYSLAQQAYKGQALEFNASARNIAESALFCKLSQKVENFLDKPGYDFYPGEYLSVTGVVFLISMFINKDLAHLMVERLEKVKKNDGVKEEEIYKGAFAKEVFTFYAKTTSSTDTDPELEQLVRYRDLMLYLNKFPTFGGNDQIEIKTRLNETIASAEAERIVEDYKGHFEFHWNKYIERKNDVRKGKQAVEDELYRNRELYFCNYGDSSMTELEDKLPTLREYIYKKILSKKVKLKSGFFNDDFPSWLDASQGCEL